MFGRLGPALFRRVPGGILEEPTGGAVVAKLPWKIDVYGHATIQWKGEGDKLFLAPSDASLQAVMGALKKRK